jgi:putative zinc finger/helix-turn-helix YgiT family protein
MICFKCQGEDFATQLAVIRQDFRGEGLDVKALVSVCSACGWQTLARGQTDELRKRTADAYREKHGLLTSTQIKFYRQQLGDMSQQAFADFLKFSVASIKRWETWQVQEEVYDQAIRMKCEEALAALRAQNFQPMIYVSMSSDVLEKTFSMQEMDKKWMTPSRWAEQASAFCITTATDEELALAA